MIFAVNFSKNFGIVFELHMYHSLCLILCLQFLSLGPASERRARDQRSVEFPSERLQRAVSQHTGAGRVRCLQAVREAIQGPPVAGLPASNAETKELRPDGRHGGQPGQRHGRADEAPAEPQDRSHHRHHQAAGGGLRSGQRPQVRLLEVVPLLVQAGRGGGARIRRAGRTTAGMRADIPSQ